MSTLKNHSLFVVQTNDDVNSIRYDALQLEIAPLAKQDNRVLGITGQPGLMFPGKTLIYDQFTGELNVASVTVREYAGEIGYGEGQNKNMNGFEVSGEFYVVADFNHKYLSNDWGSPGSDLTSQTRVYLGDIVEKKNDDTGDFEVIPMQIGNQHVHNDFGKYPHISRAGDSSVIGDSQPGTISEQTIIQASGY